MKKLYYLLLLSLIPINVYALAITLQWDYTQSTDPAVGFRMYRQDSCVGSFTPIGDIALPLQGFTDGSVVDGVIYCYQTTALDSSGLESIPSNTVQAQASLSISPINDLQVVP